MHDLEYSLRSLDIAGDERVAFSIVLAGNQILPNRSAWGRAIREGGPHADYLFWVS